MKIMMLLIILYSCLFNSTFASGKTSVLITGANRGIGLEFVKQLQHKGYDIFATARKPSKAKALNALGVKVFQLDVTDQSSIDRLAKSFDNKSLDILINNAGILSVKDMVLENVDFELFERTFKVNTLGPLRMIKSLIGNLEKGHNKTVINISSDLSSIANSDGQFYSYRTSKSGLNQINKILSEEFKSKGFIFTVFHPGWVQTDMGGKDALLTPTESVSGMIKVIEELTRNDNGKFYDLNGKVLPW
jgi:NAD(P)-dependent dehydrogenase (short-subunit alcohol dehydrogenase family)